MPNDCSACGAKLKTGGNFCSHCGKPIPPSSGYAAHYEVTTPQPPLPRHTSLSCMAAYLPGLFWIPLVSPRADDTHRAYANQGLLLTLSSVLFGAIAASILVFLWSNGYDFGQIEQLFVGFTFQNWMMRLVQIGGWLGLTALVLYAPINSICGIFHGMASDQPYRIAIFGRLLLIRPEKNG